MDVESLKKENRSMVASLIFVLPFVVLMAAGLYLREKNLKGNEIIKNLRLDEEVVGQAVETGPRRGECPRFLILTVAAGAGIFLSGCNMRTDIKIVSVGIVIAGSILGWQRWKDRGRPSSGAVLRQISYELPLIMERIVMAVQAGHDILPALKLVVRAGEKGVSGSDRESQVLRSFREVVETAEAGMTLQSSLRMASQKTESTSLRHALLHIAVAHEQGGGLLFALSELADATQSYYQESVEEQIATLPVKATLPLVVVFGGLLVILLTSPIIQTLETTVSYGVMK